MKKPKKPKSPFTEQEYEDFKRQRELRPSGRPDKEQQPLSPQQK